MAEALRDLPQSAHPDLLVGFDKADDAGIFKLNDQQALVQTVDFFPPIVDDPYCFGQIAAANALSDVFAMGGRPLTALNIVGFPAGTLDKQVLSDILRGGSDKIEEAGAVVVGGHSILDKELKYGIAVTGIIDPSKIITNSAAQSGDRLFLTKPLGTGIITTGIKRNAVQDQLVRIVTEQMAELNRTASELMIEFDAHAATDVTGYGLLGHAYEMAAASDVSIRLFAEVVPVLPEVQRLASEGMNPGGAAANRSYLEEQVHFADDLDKNLVQALFDPQTSGGLLIAVAPDRADSFRAALREHGLPDCAVGQVISRQYHALIVERISAAHWSI